MYDGAFNTDPKHDVNHVMRAYALSLFHPNPRRILMIGLSSGSWAQILANHPDVETLDIVEINPGYLSLFSDYPEVASLPRILASTSPWTTAGAGSSRIPMRAMT